MADRLALFVDRTDAGRKLAESLERFRADDPVVLALPRGGVPVAYEVAVALGAPLDILLVRKLGAPFQPEYGIGAISENGVGVIRHEDVELIGMSNEELVAIADREAKELERRARVYRGEREALLVEGRTVIVVDDGIATGGTAVAAGRVLRARGAARVILAVPVAPPGTEVRLASEFDEVICLEQPHGFHGIGQFYVDFGQLDDQAVIDLLSRAREPALSAAGSPPASDPPPFKGAAEIEVEPGVVLNGDLWLPEDARGLVIFAHGSGSSRLSPRNREVAASLNERRLATLLFDLLSDEEAAQRVNVFDIELLAARLVAVTRWAQGEPGIEELPLGYFGASTGAAAALCAAAELGSGIGAVVSRGGRPDLAASMLTDVQSPTLLIVGGADWQVLELNEQAAKLLHCEHELAVVPGATHLFEEPGALERVAELAASWFSGHLEKAAGEASPSEGQSSRTRRAAA
jgi:putative phosphoribosyl transferase